jgi:hypothetical protein
MSKESASTTTKTNTTTTTTTTQAQALPRLHILRLHEDAVQNGNNYERFDCQWVLDDSSETTQKEGNNTIVAVVVCPGDVLFVPELMTGAGEFEAMRFVGKRTTEHGRMVLHNGGAEYPEFPPDILLLQQGQHTSLRAAYAKLLDAMLLEQGGGGPESLEEIMGGETEVEEYWTQPAMLREKKRQYYKSSG